MIGVILERRLWSLRSSRLGEIGNLRREQSSFGGGFHACGGIALPQADDAETRAITHLGMRKGFQDFLHHFRGARTHGAGPLDHARRRPVQVRPMRGGAMLGVGHCRVGLAGVQVRSHALSLVKDLDGRWRSAHFHHANNPIRPTQRRPSRLRKAPFKATH